MTPLFWILVAVVVLVAFGWALISFTWNLVWFIVTGLVLGALGRLLVRGTHGLGLGTTLLAGIAGSLGGGFVAFALHLGDLAEFLMAVIVAAIVVALVSGRRRERSLRPPP